MKVYISGPITGHADYMERFEAVEQALREEFPKVEIVNPAKVNGNLPESTTWEQYMGISYLLIDMCDAVCMMKDWKQSAGACVEYGYALARDLTILSEPTGMKGGGENG